MDEWTADQTDRYADRRINGWTMDGWTGRWIHKGSGGREKESGKEINEIQSGMIGERYWEGEIALEGETINPPCHLNRDQCVSYCVVVALEKAKHSSEWGGSRQSSLPEG
ncbi:hypothetical protein V1477_008726 [Vespula maculifrons]|uniref:Uncharacterized protein n=1 Tax=Vespula maculifrons TaxID=7453 RepID=A0ABD2CDV4_VESMC